MKKLFLSVLLLSLLLPVALWAADGPGYHQLNRFKLGGEGGSGDYLTYDTAGYRVFIPGVRM